MISGKWFYSEELSAYYTNKLMNNKDKFVAQIYNDLQNEVFDFG